MAATQRQDHAKRHTAAYDQTIGITERVTSSNFVWNGILRHRFTDFLVNEIQKDGTVVHLNNPLLAAAANPANQNTAQQDSAETKKEREIPPIDEDGASSLAKLLSSDVIGKLHTLYEESFAAAAAAANTREKMPMPTPVELGVFDDKDVRGQIHQAVRDTFHSRLDTTADQNGRIKASFTTKRRGRNRNSSLPITSSGSGSVLHFTMYKLNRDTMEVASMIARRLGQKPQFVTYSGTKDRRAATVQRLSIRNRKAHEVEALNRVLFDVRVGNYEFKEEPLRLGDLAGNEFTITLKNCHYPGDEKLSVGERTATLREGITATLKSMAENGWINYFGHQRFGTFAVGTHDIGRLVLSGKLEEAVKNILFFDEKIASSGPSTETSTNSTNNNNSKSSGNQNRTRGEKGEYLRHTACQLYHQGKIDEALNTIPQEFAAEKAVLTRLSQAPNDFTGAFLRITRGLRTMYLHAYQSYVWNHMASQRWKLYGPKVVEGDLVLEGGEGNEPTLDEEETLPEEDASKSNNTNPTTVNRPKARPVTAEEVASNTFSIFDIVLPAPGFDTILPTNELGQAYQTFMQDAQCGGGVDPSQQVHTIKELTLSGNYRKFMTKFLSAPPDIVIQAAEDDEAQLVLTDLDKLLGTTGGSTKRRPDTANKLPLHSHNNNKRQRDEDASAGSHSTPDEKDAKKVKSENEPAVATDAPLLGEKTNHSTTRSQPEASVPTETSSDNIPPTTEVTIKEKSRIAVAVSFQLGKSEYATVALRELMGEADSAVVF